MSQAYGAGNLARMSIVLQRTLLLSAVFLVVLVLPMWIFCEPLLLAAGQPHVSLIARLTGERVAAARAAVHAHASQDMAVFLTAQRVVRGPMVVNVITNVVLLPLLPLLILPAPRGAGLGFIGAPIAITLRDVSCCTISFCLAPCWLRRNRATARGHAGGGGDRR